MFWQCFLCLGTRGSKIFCELRYLVFLGDCCINASSSLFMSPFFIKLDFSDMQKNTTYIRCGFVFLFFFFFFLFTSVPLRLYAYVCSVTYYYYIITSWCPWPQFGKMCWSKLYLFTDDLSVLFWPNQWSMTKPFTLDQVWPKRSSMTKPFNRDHND